MNCYWDYQNRIMVSGLDNTQQLQGLEWYLRDALAVSLYLCEEKDDDAGFDAVAAPSGYAVKFGIKASRLASATLLVYQGTWAYAAGPPIVYSGSVNLNTAALIAAVGTEDELDVIGELTLQAADGSHRDTTQFAIRIIPDILIGTEGVPDSLPAWITEHTDPVSGRKYLVLTNSDGEAVATFTPPGVTL